MNPLCGKHEGTHGGGGIREDAYNHGLSESQLIKNEHTILLWHQFLPVYQAALVRQTLRQCGTTAAAAAACRAATASAVLFPIVMRQPPIHNLAHGFSYSCEYLGFRTNISSMLDQINGFHFLYFVPLLWIPVPIPYIVMPPYHYNPSRSSWLLETDSEVVPHR